MPTLQEQRLRNMIAAVLILAFAVLSLAPFSRAQTSEAAQFLLGPQVPITSSWFDQTQISRGVFHGTAFPAPPPATYQDSYINQHYYDLGLTLYTLHARTNDPAHLALARKVCDSWWANSWWIGSGTVRLWPDNVAPPPRHAGIGGLILRALDGRPEMWDWLNAYTRFHFDHWLKKRLNDPSLFYGVREGAFMLHHAAWLAKAHPDAAIRAQYLADIEQVSVGYFGRLQQSDGSWRWNDFDFTDKVAAKLTSNVSFGEVVLKVAPLLYPVAAGQNVAFVKGGTAKTVKPQLAGSTVIEVDSLAVQRSAGDELYVDDGTLKGVTQPFMVGLLLNALVDVHRLSTNESVRDNLQNQIVKSCRHLYLDGAYTTQLVPSLNENIRGFHYFKHGGTTLNPVKYENGSFPATWDTTDRGDVQNARQAIGPIIAAFGYAYLLTKNTFFKAAGDELWDAAYGPSDGIHNYFAGDAKSYNQNTRNASKYLAFVALAGTPTAPTPEPSPTPIASPVPSPSPTPTATPVPSPTATPTPTPSVTPTPLPSPSPTCALTAPDTISIPRWGSKVVTVSLSMNPGLLGEVSGTALSGQVSVQPRTPRAVNGTSVLLDFQVAVKNNSSGVRFDTPCGSKTMQVIVTR